MKTDTLAPKVKFYVDLCLEVDRLGGRDNCPRDLEERMDAAWDSLNGAEIQEQEDFFAARTPKNL